MQRYNRMLNKMQTKIEIKTDTYDFWDYYYDSDIHEEPWGVHFDYISTERKSPFIIIDMESIYSKEMLRQRKIDKILGEIKDISNTIENILQERIK